MSQKIPRHVAIVMDGNGRWAENLDLPRVEGHRAGVETVKAIVQSCLEHHVAVLSLFAFSCENWARPQEEVDFLMQLFIFALAQEIKTLSEHGVRVQFIGSRHQLSAALCEQMEAAEALTANNTHLILNIAVNYSGKWDIVQASQILAARVERGELAIEQLDEAAFEAALSTHALPSPDLFIRTSGEQRISNFFLWQLAYTEIVFTDLKWPEFTVAEFEHALREYAHRERRYGLTSQQLEPKQDV